MTIDNSAKLPESVLANLSLSKPSAPEGEQLKRAIQTGNITEHGEDLEPVNLDNESLLALQVTVNGGSRTIGLTQVKPDSFVSDGAIIVFPKAKINEDGKSSELVSPVTLDRGKISQSFRSQYEASLASKQKKKGK